MTSTSNLKILLRSMNPEIISGEFVFCTINDAALSKLKAKPLLVFREKEGVTVILEKKDADACALKYGGTWAQITLTVHSDLNAVGFLAEITRALAGAGISVNAVSAYYHDHLFVHSEKAKESMKVLEKITKTVKN